jgi:predicted RNA-binding Zn ribbon-like protein
MSITRRKNLRDLWSDGAPMPVGARAFGDAILPLVSTTTTKKTNRKRQHPGFSRLCRLKKKPARTGRRGRHYYCRKRERRRQKFLIIASPVLIGVHRSFAAAARKERSRSPLRWSGGPGKPSIDSTQQPPRRRKEGRKEPDSQQASREEASKQASIVCPAMNAVKRLFERKDPLLHRALGGSTKKDGTNSRDEHVDNDDDDSDIDKYDDNDELQRMNQQHGSNSKNNSKKNSKEPEKDAVLNIHELATKRRIRQKDRLQRNALHIACANKPTLELIQLLYERYPKGVDETDKAGRLPLHTAVAKHADIRVIEYLLQVFPDAIHECTDRGVRCVFYHQVSFFFLRSFFV